MAVLTKAEIKEKEARERGKVAVCASCNQWFTNYQDRNTHRVKCPKRIACQSQSKK